MLATTDSRKPAGTDVAAHVHIENSLSQLLVSGQIAGGWGVRQRQPHRHSHRSHRQPPQPKLKQDPRHANRLHWISLLSHPFAPF
jgi:hypothetical protein